jgi:hypothetical protein
MQNYPGQVWPMYSCESLSGQDQNITDPSKWCLARAFNAGGTTQAKICGTADMLYSWSWDQIMELFDTTYRDLYLNDFQNYDNPIDTTKSTPYLALYEAQFINPKWMTNGFDSTLLQNCQGSCEDKLVKCTTNDICTNFIKNNSSICPKNYTGYCKTNGFCHFQPPGPGTTCNIGDNNCYFCNANKKPQICNTKDCTGGKICDPSINTLGCNSDNTLTCKPPCDQKVCDPTSETCYCKYCNNGDVIKYIDPNCTSSCIKCNGTVSCDAGSGQLVCSPNIDDTDPYCGPICTDPKGCYCKNADASGTCISCTDDTDCTEKCVPKSDSQC